jgi:hypothetical protein
VKDKHHHQTINTTRAIQITLFGEDPGLFSTSANGFDRFFFQEDILDKFRRKHIQIVFGNS